MKHRIFSFGRSLAICLAAAFTAATASAVNIYKADNADNLNLTTSWTGGATPTVADIAVWDNTVTAANTVLLGVDTNWAGIKILDPAGLVTVSPNVSAAPVTATVNSPTFTYSSAPANPLANGNRAMLGGITTNAPTGFTLNTVIYFVVNATPTTFQLSATSGGTAISVGATTAGTAVTVTGGPNLTLGASGIDMSLATNSLTLSTPLVLGVNQTWNVTNGLTLTAGGVVSGSSLLTLNNGGNNGGAIILSAANTYTGGTVINSGIAQPNLVNSFGTGVVTNNGGTMLLSTFPNAGILVNALYFTGTSMIDMNNRSISAVLNTAWSGSGTVLITNDTASGSTFTIGGATGGNMANFSGSVVIVSTNAAGTGSAGTVRLNNGGTDVNFGSVNLSLDLGTGATVFLDRNRAGNTLNIGALSGGVSGQSVPSIKIGSSGTGGTTYSVGGKNLNTTFAGIFDGTGATTTMFLALTKVGTGIFTLAGNNTYNGVTTISGGILRIGDGATSGYGTLGTGNVTDNATLAFARPDAISIANIISGSGNLVQGGGNTLTLNSANTYGGATIVTNGGTIIVGTAGAVPANTALTLGGAGTAGTLDMFGNNVQVNSLNTGSGATGSIIGSSGSSNPTLLTVNATNGSSAFSGVIKDTLPSGGSGVVALVVENGKLTLTGANTYSGSTTISNGTVVLGTGGSIASSTIILNGAGTSVLDATAVGGIALSSGYVLAASGGVGGNVTAANCLITPGTNGTVGTLTCSNNLSLNGGGTIHFDLSSSPASGNDQIVVGSALNLSGVTTIEISPLSLLGAGTYKLFVCGSVNGTLGNLSLTGSPGSGFTAALSVTGTEVDLVVTAVAAPFVWRGDGSLNQWDYATANWRSNGVASDFTDGAFAVFDNTGSNTPSIDITAPVSPATVTVNSTINYTLGSVGGSGKLTGLGSLTKTNTSTLTILTANDYTGGTTINQGTLRVSDGSTAGATLGNGNVVNKASLVFNQPDNYDFTNVISGTGNLTQLGSSTLTLSGNNTYSGTTLISAGTLQVGDGNTSGALGTNAVMDNAALAFNRSDSVVQSGLITGTGTLTVVGGTVSVTASNDFSGATTINSGGTLQLGNGGATGSVPLNNVTNNGTLAFNHSTSETNGIVITGSGGISKLAGNTLTLTAANNYNGDTAISAGTLKIGAAGTLPSGSGFGNVVLDGGDSTAGTLDLNGFDTILNGINGSSNSILGMVVNNSGTAINALNVGAGDATTTFNGLIADNTGAGGRIALNKTGAGTFTLGGTNSYTGGTVISNGVLALGSNQANTSGLGSSNVTFRGGTLQLFGYTGNNGNHYNALTNGLFVATGQTGTLELFQRGPTDNTGITAPLTGSGTLNLVVSYVRASIDGDWSAFTGLINVTSSAGTEHFRTKNTYGYANAAILLNDGVIMYCNGNANATIDIGELSGTSGAFLGLSTVSQNNAVANPTWRVGARNTTNTFAGVIRDDTSTSIIKVGTGTWTLTGANTYSGSTTISNGVLALGDGVTDGSIGSSANIDIVSGAVLDVSGRVDKTLGLNGGQTLRGNGRVAGSVTAGSGSTVSPADATGVIGLLTITNLLSLQSGSAVNVDLDATALTNDVVVAGAGVTYGGTLNINFVNGTPTLGQTFKLFSAPPGQYGGSFDGGVSPATFNGLTWHTSNLAVNGTISVVIATPPSFSSIVISGSDIVLNAINGTPGGPVTVLTSTNIALPLAQWTTVTTGNFDGSGNFTYPVSGALSSGQPQQFYILQTQ